MGEEKRDETGAPSSRHASSSTRRDQEDRDRHRHRDREQNRGSRRRDGEERRHASRSDRREEGRKDDSDRYRHRHHHHHRSHHHSSASRDRHRETDRDEDHSERKRRRKEDDRDDSKSHESRSHRSRHHDESKSSSHRSRSDKESHHRESTDKDKQPATDFIPTSDSLNLTSHAAADAASGEGGATTAATSMKRDDWMLSGTRTDPTSTSSSDPDASIDEASYFSSLGKARVKAPRPEKPDPEKLKISSRELNTQLREGKTVDQYDTPSNVDSRPHFGGPGYQWRMMKLKRTLEAAEQEGRKVEEVALERYATLEDFEYAREERRFLDGRGENNNDAKGKGKTSEATGRGTPTLQSVARRSYLLASGGGPVGDGVKNKSGTDSPGSSRPASRQGFRRPGESSNSSTPAPAPAAASRPQRNIGFETPASKPTTPTNAIPTVFTPVFERPAPPSGDGAGIVLDDGSTDPDRPTLTPDQLNKLQARIMQAELMGDDESVVESLKAEYERESARAQAHLNKAGDRGGGFAPSTHSTSKGGSESAGVLVHDGERELQVLPTLDARGRMYDVGSLSSTSPPPPSDARERKKHLKNKEKFSSRDPATGNIIRYSADDDSLSLSDLVRQEKFSAGPSISKNFDSELASNILTDANFSNDLDDQDDDAQRYAKKKMKSDAMKRQFAINDFARTKKVLDRCRFCWQDEGNKPPRAMVVSSGFRAYLAIPDTEAVGEEEEGTVVIVPMQHHLSLLEADEETWDEMKNFMKCLIQLAAKKGKKVIFWETVLSIKAQLHSVMEAVMVPGEAMDLLPGVFKESLRSVGGEFSTHKKVIEFTPERPFRNALVPNLPYFAVSWDNRWSNGYGHVIENMDSQKGGGNGEDEDAFDVDEMSAGGGGRADGKFDPNFARDVIRGVLEDLDNEREGGSPVGGGGYIRSFGRSKRRSEDEKRRVKAKFKKDWDAFDWTKMLQSS